MVVVAGVGVAGRFVAPVDAQTEPPAPEVLSLTADGEPLGQPTPPSNLSPSISDDGNVVAFVTGTGAGSRVAVRDRAAGTTMVVAETGSSHPAISADGCWVAYVVSIPADPAVAGATPKLELRVVDRCTEPFATSPRSPDSDAPGDTIADSTAPGDGSGDTDSPDTTAPDADDPVPDSTTPDSTVPDSTTPASTTPASTTPASTTPASTTPPSAPAVTVTADGVLRAGTLAGTYDLAAAVATPALSADGASVVWSTGVTVVRHVRFVSAAGGFVYVQDSSFDPIAAGTGVVPAGSVTGAGVDVSADAHVVAFVAGPGTAPYAPANPDVFVWSDDPADADPPVVELVSTAAPGSPSAGGSTHPALSGDGSILLFESTDPGVAAAAGSPAAVGPFVAVHDRADGSSIVLESDARRPAISTDGHHAVYDHAGVVRSVRWGDGSPFEQATRAIVVGLLDGDAGTSWETAGGPVVSAHGEAIAFDNRAGGALTADVRFHTGSHVWLVAQPPTASGTDLDLGTADVPATLTGTVTFSNTGAAGIPVQSVAVDSPFRLVTSTCTGVLHPGATCTVDVAVTVIAGGTFDGDVRVKGGTPQGEFTASLRAAGVVPPTTTRAPRTVPPRTTRTIPPRTTPRVTTSGTTPLTTATVPLAVVFNPPAFDFAPTIAGAGRRTAAVDLFNPSNELATVTAVRVLPEDGSGFTADGTACISQPLAIGETCSVVIEFAPPLEGAVGVTVVADLADGTSANLALSGVGAPPPTLTVTPDVAANGQVVAVEGAGFPAGGAIEMSWDDGLVTRSVVTDEIGGFVETLVVPPDTTRGPTEIVVFGQVDVFADVVADLLISRTGSRTDVVVFGGLGPSIVR